MFNWIKKFVFFTKTEDDKPLRKVCGVRGENHDGEVIIDIAHCDADGNFLAYPAIKEYKLRPDKKIRLTVNRILAGTASENDDDVFSLWVSSKI